MFKGKPLRLGLCCLFASVPIRFRSRQAGHMMRLERRDQLDRLSTTVLHNGSALLQALEYCWHHNIGGFRINSQFLPLKSHPTVGYELADLPEYSLISELFSACRDYARQKNIRLTFHPDQFTLLSSPRQEVLENSLRELSYHGELAELLGADVIQLHGGGAYGDKSGSLRRLVETFKILPLGVQQRLALENDDRIYTVRELLPICLELGIPLVYDVHHHRCLPDGLSEDEAARAALATWKREPLFHVSSPKLGWHDANPRPHHDYLQPDDFPRWWQELELTVEVEAKAKELALARLMDDLARREHTPGKKGLQRGAGTRTGRVQHG